MRIGDAERDAVIEQLNQHYAAGRLTQLEHEERTSLALTARTAADLDVLLADLPPLDDKARGRSGRRRRGLAIVPPHVLRIALAAVLVFALLHALPVIFLVAIGFFVMRGMFGRHCGVHHAAWRDRRW
jgi:hypothetical protein